MAQEFKQTNKPIICASGALFRKLINVLPIFRRSATRKQSVQICGKKKRSKKTSAKSARSNSKSI